MQKHLIIITINESDDDTMPSMPNDLPVEIRNRYDIVNNTFIGKDKGEKHSELEIEIGDVHSATFHPQIKLKRWENECNFSVRLINDDTDLPTIEIKGNKIKFIKNQSEAHFYDVQKTKKMPDCYEFEVVLKEKPKTNKVQMSIETKGLAFYYQPELTQEEIDEGCFRPENVVGSYAVYHESKQGDYSKTGGKNYRAGKAFHIYRPKIIDSVGTEVWGKLNITGDLLTVEIPHDFLDNAVYPIRHAAGLTFGCDPESPGGSIWGLSGDYNLVGSWYENTAGSGTGDDIKTYITLASGTSRVCKTALYTYVADGNAGALIEETEEKTIVTASSYWETFNFLVGPSIENNTKYHFAVWAVGFTGPQIEIYFDSISGGGWYDKQTYGDWLDPMTGENATDNIFSIYCTYTSTTTIPVFNHLQNQMRQ